MQLSTFFQFLQIAIGTRSELSHSLSENDWQQLFDLCQRQALLGVGYHAVEVLHQQGQSCPKSLALKWAILAQRIKEVNKQMTVECQKVSQLLKEEGFESCILKGQGNLAYYPDDLKDLRQSGDIDIWVHAPNTHHPVRTIICYAERTLPHQTQPCYHHAYAHLSMISTTELHYRPSYCFAPWYNWRFQKWSKQERENCMKPHPAFNFPVPTLRFNLIYQLLHIYRHFFEYGIGLRQLMDYYFLLQTCAREQASHPQIAIALQHDLNNLGLWHFARSLMWTMGKVFEHDTQQQVWMIAPPYKAEGQIILQDILRGGNFGQHIANQHEMRQGSLLLRTWYKTQRIWRFVCRHPSEILSALPFRIWHYLWRRFQWWRF